MNDVRGLRTKRVVVGSVESEVRQRDIAAHRVHSPTRQGIGGIDLPEAEERFPSCGEVVAGLRTQQQRQFRFGILQQERDEGAANRPACASDEVVFHGWQ